MTSFIRISIVLTLLLSLQACKNGTFYNQQNGILIRKEFHKGTLLSESQCKVFGKDTLLEGESKTYESSSRLFSILHWIHNEKDGLCLYFNKAGDTVVTGFYKDNLKDSIWHFYSQFTPKGNINLNSIVNYRKDKPFGNNLLFNPKHKLIDYFFYNFKGKIAYHRFYDNNGVFLKETSYPFCLMSMDTNCKNNVLSGDIRFPSPPDCSEKLFSALLLNDKDTIGWQQIGINSDIGIYNNKINKPGNYTWITKFCFFDLVNGKERNRIIHESYLFATNFKTIPSVLYRPL